MVRLNGHEVEFVADWVAGGGCEIWLRVDRGVPSGQEFRWRLSARDRLIELQTARNGEVLFSDIPEGSYRCVLIRESGEVGTLSIQLEDRSSPS